MHRLRDVLTDREAIAIDLADQRHRGGVLRILREAFARFAQSGHEIAALVGAESEIGRRAPQFGRGLQIRRDHRRARRLERRPRGLRVGRDSPPGGPDYD
jgi:hypothetical protein